MEKKIVVTAAYPFIPAEINMAHFASTYIPADICFRFLKEIGKNVTFVSATDVHGISIKNLAKGKNTDINTIIDSYHQKYLSIFEQMGIYFNYYARTDTTKVEESVRRSVTRLYEKEKIYRKKSINYLCKNCGEYLPKHYRLSTGYKTATDKMILSSEMSALKCFFCHSEEIEKEEIEHWFLKFDDECKQIISRVVNNQNNKYVKNYLKSILDNGLQDWDFTRDNYWGLKFPIKTNVNEQYIYLWYESLIAYLSLFDYDCGDHVLLKHFMSKNIVYYHGIIWPVLLYLGIPGTSNFELQISDKGFLNINESDPILVNVRSALDNFERDYLRFYVSYLVKDNITDFKFVKTQFIDIINSILCKNIGGFFKRCRNIIYKYNITTVPLKFVRDNFFDKLILEYKKKYIKKECNELLEDALGYIKHCGKEIEVRKIYNCPSEENIGLLCFMLAGALILMKKFIPDLVEVYNIFDEFSLDLIDNINSLNGKKILKKDGEWSKI